MHRPHQSSDLLPASSAAIQAELATKAAATKTKEIENLEAKTKEKRQDTMRLWKKALNAKNRTEKKELEAKMALRAARKKLKETKTEVQKIIAEYSNVPERERALKNRLVILNQMTSRQDRLSKELSNREEEIKNDLATLKKDRARLEKSAVALKKKEATFTRRETALKKKEALLTKREATFAKRVVTLKTKEEEIKVWRKRKPKRKATEVRTSPENRSEPARSPRKKIPRTNSSQRCITGGHGIFQNLSAEASNRRTAEATMAVDVLSQLSNRPPPATNAVK
jgi:chromosome segregation ATPase